MGLESGVPMHPLREELQQMDSPLARKVNQMGEDSSLEKINLALNSIGKGFEEFNVQMKEEDAIQIMEKLIALVHTPDAEKEEIKERIKDICKEIDSKDSL